MNKLEFLNKIKGQLIVSCQALKGEPLHGASIMAKMALAAEMGGAAGIRANGTKDVAAIKKVTNLPIIGLIKRDYEDSDVYITPSKKEIDELMNEGVDVIAIDATRRKRPNGETLDQLINYMKYKGQLILADISTVEEGLMALEAGADFLSTTLSGYTPYTSNRNQGPDEKLVKELSSRTSHPVIAEGRIGNPQDGALLLNNGAYAVVVGSAITRPQQITESFTKVIKKEKFPNGY